jgi:hypothetical protein
MRKKGKEHIAKQSLNQAVNRSLFENSCSMAQLEQLLTCG